MSIAEKLQRIEAERRQTEAQARPAPNAQEITGQDRKSRTRRLIQLGALTDQYLETGGCSPEAAGRFLLELSRLQEVQRLIQNRRPG